MTRRVSSLVGVLVFLVGASVCLTAQSVTSPLEGVWAVEDITGGNDPSRTNNPTGLVIFSGRHYALMQVRDSNRPLLLSSAIPTASADQLRAELGGFGANAGTLRCPAARTDPRSPKTAR